jgi:hypothetical protein
MSKKPHVKPEYDKDWIMQQNKSANAVKNSFRMGDNGNNDIITQDSNPSLWAELYDTWDRDDRPGVLIHDGIMYNALVVDECATFVEVVAR